MIWNGADPMEYSNVFAWNKKLALMLVHNSIIARIKQTWDTNQKRQLVPFKKEDLVYLSTKNIKFTQRKFLFLGFIEGQWCHLATALPN